MKSPPDTQTKRYLVITSGALSLFAGIFIGIAVSWYAVLVVQDYAVQRPNGMMNNMGKYLP